MPTAVAATRHEARNAKPAATSANPSATEGISQPLTLGCAAITCTTKAAATKPMSHKPTILLALRRQTVMPIASVPAIAGAIVAL